MSFFLLLLALITSFIYLMTGLHNIGDETTFYASNKDLDSLIKRLEKGTLPLEWLDNMF